ncbi:hypothetical protein C8R45DRAFT_931217 [Mycena sanguinolenta]|nr:hypothetical protein C8R45DRAFT_931217 [Mycena sanguinolenta]
MRKSEDRHESEVEKRMVDLSVWNTPEISRKTKPCKAGGKRVPKGKKERSSRPYKRIRSRGFERINEEEITAKFKEKIDGHPVLWKSVTSQRLVDRPPLGKPRTAVQTSRDVGVASALATVLATTETKKRPARACWIAGHFIIPAVCVRRTHASRPTAARFRMRNDNGKAPARSINSARVFFKFGSEEAGPKKALKRLVDAGFNGEGQKKIGFFEGPCVGGKMYILPKLLKSARINIDVPGLRSKTRRKMYCLPRKLPDLDVAVGGRVREPLKLLTPWESPWRIESDPDIDEFAQRTGLVPRGGHAATAIVVYPLDSFNTDTGTV